MRWGSSLPSPCCLRRSPRRPQPAHLVTRQTEGTEKCSRQRLFASPSSCPVRGSYKSYSRQSLGNAPRPSSSPSPSQLLLSCCPLLCPISSPLVVSATATPLFPDPPPRSAPPQHPMPLPFLFISSLPCSFSHTLLMAALPFECCRLKPSTLSRSRLQKRQNYLEITSSLLTQQRRPARHTQRLRLLCQHHLQPLRHPPASPACHVAPWTRSWGTRRRLHLS